MKALAVALIAALVAFLLIGFQQYRYVGLQGAMTVETKNKNEAIEADKVSQATITSLRDEAKRNADYQADLNKRLKDSEQKALKARKDFDDLKRKSPAVRKWADQPLPDGLRGKPAASGNKDNGGKARTP